MIKSQRNSFFVLSVIFFLSVLLGMKPFPKDNSPTKLQFKISYTESAHTGPLTGRMFLIITKKEKKEPRLQVSRYAPQLFGVNFKNLHPGETVTINHTTLGYPINELGELPPGEYYIQAVLNKYTKFERKDGHVVWMHMDQWEGQRWNRSPGNIYSKVKKLKLNPKKEQSVHIKATQVIPPVEVPSDTRWVKRFKIKSQLLTEFWGHPIYLGATVLLPKGYQKHPETHYPTLYKHGHFSLRAPFGFKEEEKNDFYHQWISPDFPRFIVVKIQHPTPYFDDSYAVNSPNNGPYGDAIHQELIPEIEKRFRVIPKSYARVLTGGSTGGWISFALQVLHPDFYGGTWSFAPDPLDFRNVEGINIYEDKNAFYKQHEWYKVPIPNTREPETGEIILTSKQRNTMELVHGTKGRSGQQLDIWSAVFGPVGEDGYFKPLFDKRTGKIDPEVAEYWKKNYDMRYYMETHWDKLAPKLVDKIHVFCGRMDHFYLNVGVYHMENFLKSLKNPFRVSSFMYGDKGGHGWHPFSTAELLKIMAEHITEHAPSDADPDSWKYK